MARARRKGHSSGAGCVEHLRGMFAFALWDRRLRRLLIARDRLGIKPLYYAQRGPRLYFASEVKCLLQIPEIEPRLSWRSIAHLFSFLSTPDDESIIAGVKKLEPGHRLLAAPHRHVDADGPDRRRTQAHVRLAVAAGRTRARDREPAAPSRNSPPWIRHCRCNPAARRAFYSYVPTSRP